MKTSNVLGMFELNEYIIGDTGGQPFKLAKNDLIAELKLSHNVGGVSKLRSEQQKMQEGQERSEYRRFLAQFTTENFLEKVPQQDPNGGEIPIWKREMMAKKAAEKAKKEAIEKRAQEEEYRKMVSIPAWKRQLIENRKTEDPKNERHKKREKERRKKLICKL